MRRWIITVTLVANALLGALVLLKLWYQAGWGNAARLSSTETRLLIVVAVAAVAFTLLLVPVLGISFWVRDRGTRRLQARVATLAEVSPARGPSVGGGAAPAGGADTIAPASLNA
jgi:hypothetical protein